jgi:hypothetical protein
MAAPRSLQASGQCRSKSRGIALRLIKCRKPTKFERKSNRCKRSRSCWRESSLSSLHCHWAKSWVASTWFVLGDAIVCSSHARLTCGVGVRARVMKESAQVSLLCRYLLLELQKTVSHGRESVGGCSNETETEITEMRYPETLKLPRASLQCIPMTLVA